MVTLDPAPFLRGNPFPGTAAVPYPRAAIPDAARLPGSTWRCATMPIGVRLELRGDARAVVVDYRTETEGLVPTTYDVGGAFEIWGPDAAAEPSTIVPAGLGAGSVSLPLHVDGTTTVYLPARMRPTITSLTPVDGTLSAPSRAPRWLAYGDSIVEGWVASSIGASWPARLGRRLGLDVCNLGYAGSARGELPSAEHLASVPATVVTISYGTNCWSTIPFTTDMLRAGVDAFLTIVRQGHPETPIVVTTPLRRPEAEHTRNRVGATLAELRDAMAAAVQARTDAGDTHLTLVDGKTLLEAEYLADRVHPGDEGHALLADRLEPILRSLLGPATPAIPATPATPAPPDLPTK